jgi:hypothetical protein
VAGQRPICFSNPAVQREEAGTAGIRQIPTLCGPSRRAVLSSVGQHGAALCEILLGVAEPDAECVRDSIAVGRIVLQAVGDVRGSPYRHVNQGEAKTIF